MYSKSYAEVGVLFASMPNFSDFYTEESVNNQGLECLRFLNEVISDFDAVSGTFLTNLVKSREVLCNTKRFKQLPLVLLFFLSLAFRRTKI